MRITSLCLNPCIDRTADCAVFDLSSPNRIRLVRDDIGGKGINTAVETAALGGESALVLLSPSEDRARLLSVLDKKGVRCRDVPVPGRLRVNLKIRTPDGQTVEINEEGPRAGRDALDTCAALMLESARESAFCLLTGSLPPGAGDDLYRRLAAALRPAGVRTAVDADGAALREALGARPDLIKPNRGEFARLTGLRPGTPEECCRACRDLILSEGVGAVCLSLGAEGAVYVTETKALYAPAADVPVLSLHGAGDSMLSALCLFLSRGESEKEAFRAGAAAAAATISLPGTEMASAEDVRRMLGRVRVENVPV